MLSSLSLFSDKTSLYIIPLIYTWTAGEFINLTPDNEMYLAGKYSVMLLEFKAEEWLDKKTLKTEAEGKRVNKCVNRVEFL